MLYREQAVEVIKIKEVFGQEIAWIRILETGEAIQVPATELSPLDSDISMAHIRFNAVACKIKEEVARKSILAPYESSLIPLPHQILVLEKVMESVQNRFLLADEVGMGKTIEAGLILKELKLRGDVERILVIVPKSAMLQWQGELKEHFNENFHVYDSQLIAAFARAFGSRNVDNEFNFWEQHNHIIVSTDALKPMTQRAGWSQERIENYNRYRMEAVLRAEFDLVVIDEVHKMGGSSPLVSRYQLAQALCNVVPNALLLSATPHRGKSDHFRRILQLLDPDAFDGEGLPTLSQLEPYVIRTEKRLAIDYEGNKLFNERETKILPTQQDPSLHVRQLRLYDDVTEYVITGFNAAVQGGNSATGLIMVLFQRLLSSSTAALHSAMKRRLGRLRDGIRDDAEADWEEATESEVDFSEIALTGVQMDVSLGFSENEEITMLEKLVSDAENCLRNEPDAKVETFLARTKALKREYNNADLKFLVFTEFRATQNMLEEVLEEHGYRCEIINGSQSLDERKRALVKFKNESQILIATDAAGESLNMQFCHIIFNYDLPWNPMVIEQRIGRVDRIGQKNTVIAYNMLLDNSIDSRVYQIIQTKLDLILTQLGIDKTSDVLDSTLETEDINQLYLQSLLDPSSLEETGEKWLANIKEKLKNYQATEGILPEIREEEIDSKAAGKIRHSPLPVWLEQLTEQYAAVKKGNVKRRLDQSFEITVGDYNLAGTFDAESALANPGMVHLTLQHPFIKSAIDYFPAMTDDTSVPVVKMKDAEIGGLWTLWKIKLVHPDEGKITYYPVFTADDGRIYSAYAKEIWKNLITGEKDMFTLDKQGNYRIENQESKKIDNKLKEIYDDMAIEVNRILDKKKANMEQSFNYQKSRLMRIGIANIRQSKITKLEREYLDRKSNFARNRKFFPDVQQIMALRING